MTSYAPSTTSSRYSVYQTNGRPLSEEATYKAKQKYGLYQSPAKVDIGVDASAPDQAALLAASSDLSVHPYRRETSADAATAALFAKTDSSPAAWKRGSVAVDAEQAATSANSQKYPFDAEAKEGATGAKKAASIDELAAIKRASQRRLSKSQRSEAALRSLYAFDEIRSGKSSVSQAQFSKMDIRSINDQAAATAAKTMNSRLQPGPNATSTIVGARKAPSKTASTSSFNIGKISAIAQKSAQNSIHGRLQQIERGAKNRGLQTRSDYRAQPAYEPTYGLTSGSSEAKLANGAAAASLKEGPTGDFASSERATLAGNTLVDSRVLALAMKRANATLSKIDKERSLNDLFKDPALNDKALKIAKERVSKTQTATATSEPQVNCGGGLFVPYSKLHAMAESVVQPALKEIDEKVQLQRDYDKQHQTLVAQVKDRKYALKEEAKALKVKEAELREKGSAERRVQLQTDKDTAQTEHEETIKQQEAELAEKQKEYDDQMAVQAEAQKELDEEREQKLSVLNDAKAEKDATRAAELEEQQKEADTDLEPILEELSKEKAELEKLEAEKDAQESFFNEQKFREQTASESLETTKYKIEKLTAQLTQLETESASATVAADEDEATEATTKEIYDKTVSEKKEVVSTLKSKRSELESERDTISAKHSKLIEKLNSSAKENFDDAKEINGILPEHLQDTVEEPSEITDDLDHDKFVPDDTTIEEPPEIEAEPEVTKDKVWSYEDEQAAKAAEAAAKEAPVEESVEVSEADGFANAEEKLVHGKQGITKYFKKTKEKVPTAEVEAEAVEPVEKTTPETSPETTAVKEKPTKAEKKAQKKALKEYLKADDEESRKRLLEENKKLKENKKKGKFGEKVRVFFGGEPSESSKPETTTKVEDDADPDNFSGFSQDFTKKE